MAQALIRNGVAKIGEQAQSISVSCGVATDISAGTFKIRARRVSPNKSKLRATQRAKRSNMENNPNAFNTT